tara:strand:- start:204 stop:575 length:372 start_codon:yes stop_codon:yes gene_type:complete
MKKWKVAIIPAGDGPVSLKTMEGEDGPSFKEIYPLINTNMIQIVEGKWNDVKDNIIFDCDLYCDEEGRLTGKQHNWRASQLRYNKLKSIEDQLTPDWRDWCHVVGDVAMVVEEDPDLQWEATG